MYISAIYIQTVITKYIIVICHCQNITTSDEPGYGKPGGFPGMGKPGTGPGAIILTRRKPEPVSGFTVIYGGNNGMPKPPHWYYTVLKYVITKPNIAIAA